MDKAKEAKEKKSYPPIRVGISIGDINGIGPEVIMKAFEDNRILIDCTPIIYGSSKVFSFYKKQLNINEFNYQSVQSAKEAANRKVNVINVFSTEPEFEVGHATENGGKFAFESLEAATQDLAGGKIDVLVTAPISKDAMAKSGFKFPGHTEYLADLAGGTEALMIMAANDLRVGLVTSHIALNKVSESITLDRVYEKIMAFTATLKKDFMITKPKIAVFGLNPHAGESGNMGSEENAIIVPAIHKANNEGAMAFGPYPADGFFGSGARKQFDGVLAMYHDQGLAAFKAIAFDEGVNFTAGLPIIRTSPDHGTAFDIAGKNEASAQSIRSAIYLAMDVFRNHQAHKEATANPLPYDTEPRRHRGGSEE